MDSIRRDSGFSVITLPLFLLVFLYSAGSHAISPPLSHEVTPYVRAEIGWGVNDQDTDIGNVSSRVGLAASVSFIESLKLFGRLEYGINPVDRADNTVVILAHEADQPATGEVETDIFLRLGYVGVKSPLGEFSGGKIWGVYYEVAGWTDAFDVFGGTALGVYPGGDGGGIGTGRAEKALQYWDTFGDLSFGVQYQSRGTVSFDHSADCTFFSTGADCAAGEGVNLAHSVYSYGYGVALTWAFNDNINFGMAYNRAAFPNYDADTLERYSLTNNRHDVTGVIGVDYRLHEFYMAVAATENKNHVLINNQYMDSIGAELYTAYDFTPDWQGIFGGNWMAPRSGEEDFQSYRLLQWYLGARRNLIGDFDSYAFVSLRYDLTKDTSGDINYANNMIVIGVRYNFYF